MSEQPRVSSDRVLEIIRQDTIGNYVLRAAIAEATCEAYQQRLDELERPTTAMAEPDPRHAAEQAQF